MCLPSFERQDVALQLHRSSVQRLERGRKRRAQLAVCLFDGGSAQQGPGTAPRVSGSIEVAGSCGAAGAGAVVWAQTKGTASKATKQTRQNPAVDGSWQGARETSDQCSKPTKKVARCANTEKASVLVCPTGPCIDTYGQLNRPQRSNKRDFYTTIAASQYL